MGIGDLNTLEGIQTAIQIGYRGIEFDVLATADDILVLGHDDDLTRRTGRSRYISELTYQELSKLQTLHGNCIPQLLDILKVLQDQKITIVIDPKTFKTFRLCQQFFDNPIDFGNMTIILGRPVQSLNYQCISINTDQIYHKPPWLLQLLVRYQNAIVWTVNDERTARFLKKCHGVCAIITDNIL